MAGICGLVVPCGDTNALAVAMESLLADPVRRRRMGVAGRKRALRLFDWERTAEQFEDIYRDIGARAAR